MGKHHSGAADAAVRRTYREADSRWPGVVAPVLVALLAVAGGVAAVLIFIELLG